MLLTVACVADDWKLDLDGKQNRNFFPCLKSETLARFAKILKICRSTKTLKGNFFRITTMEEDEES